MANKKNTYKKKQTAKSSKAGKTPFKFDLSFIEDRKFRVSLGFLIMFFALFLTLSMISYLFTGRADQSVVEATGARNLVETGQETRNWLGLVGAGLAHLFIYRWFGISSLLLVPLLFTVGYEIAFYKRLLPIPKTAKATLFGMFWVSLAMGYFALVSEQPMSFYFLAGGIGFRVATVFNSMIGWGTIFFLIFSMGVFLLYFLNKAVLFTDLFKEKEENKARKVDSLKKQIDQDQEEELNTYPPAPASEGKPVPANTTTPAPALPSEVFLSRSVALTLNNNESTPVTKKEPVLPDGGPAFSVEDTTAFQEATVVGSKTPGKTTAIPGEQLVIEDYDLYDPKRDLSSYRYPTLDLLNEGGSGKVKVTTEELQQNKERIVDTLHNFKIGITSIKATIGPTVTLYEIVPDPGVKISRIKSLEDDIALNLSALGIRIIAPIPGKGTIGIEVPNKNREMVSLRSVLATEKFMNTDKELPIVLGKTISNEVFMTDLAKMPHLLMAGATGQGKSVGLNVILASLIYKKHPSELKFVLVDPKKVELTLFNKLERHFLAALPDSEEAILTDTKKVVHVLNSLCIEMDIRYNLLKDAGCRNLKEYNTKFMRRRLNPEHGHRFLPYIVLVIDELADLMMTAGKEVETPIARLAQLARAIGIHLIIATQRPSVDVITGLIKANFPARLSFKVSSKVDSRTILDASGADQLVGQGDMLLSNGSDIIRLQCAYLDTDEVNRICEFVGEQRGYDTAYLLPEFEDENNGSKNIDLSSRDSMFEEAARLIVVHQQGSTSLIQRKLSLGYNRAGRIIDQLEAAGIVGPYEGSKARQVLVDEYGLEQILNGLSNLR